MLDEWTALVTREEESCRSARVFGSFCIADGRSPFALRSLHGRRRRGLERSRARSHWRKLYSSFG